MTKGLLYLDLDERYPRGFSNSELELWQLRGFSTLKPELCLPKGFSTSILITGDPEASLPRNLNCGDQRASLPRSWWKVIKGLLYFGTRAVATKGLLCLRTWIVVTKGLLYLNLELWHCSWRFVYGGLSFKNLFTEIFRLKICSQRFVFWRFIHEDLSFEDFLQEKQGLICITHVQPLFNLRIWWLWCYGLILVRTWIGHRWMILVCKLMHDFLGTSIDDDFLFLFFEKMTISLKKKKEWGMDECS